MSLSSQKIYGKNNSRVIIVFGDWGAKQYQLWLLGQLLASYKFKAMIVTWDPAVFSSNAEMTTTRFEEITSEVLKTIRYLPKREQKQVSVFGIGLGTIPAFMVANQSFEVKKIIANITCSDLAETVWTWKKETNNELKKNLLKQKMTLQRLKDLWFDLSPINNIDRLNGKKVLLYLAKFDEVFPFSQQEQFLNALYDQEIETNAIINTRHNHTISALINLLRFDTYIHFLKS